MTDPAAETQVVAPAEKSVVPMSDEMKAMLRQDAAAEVQENGLSLPFLNVYIANRSVSKLANGQDPQDGFFYYVPTQEEFKEVYCHILHISRGFRQLQKADDGSMRPRYEHLVSGVILDDKMKPFVMHIAGSHRLEKLWDFQSIVRKINNRGIPTFSMPVKLSTEKVNFKQGNIERVARVVLFEISRAANGDPEVIDDQVMYMKLRENALEMKKYELQYISRVEVDADGERVITQLPTDEDIAAKLPPPLPDPSMAAAVEEVAPPAIDPAKVENVNPDDIPF